MAAAPSPAHVHLCNRACGQFAFVRSSFEALQVLVSSHLCDSVLVQHGPHGDSCAGRWLEGQCAVLQGGTGLCLCPHRRQDPDVEVRLSCVEALGRFGEAARP